MTPSHRIADFLPSGWYRIAAIVAAIALVAVVLLTPTQSGQSFDSRLSSTLSGPSGAKGLYDLATRLGWKTQRRKYNSFDDLGAGTIVTELLPPVSLSDRETSLLLRRIRAGASLLFVVDDGSPLADSLHLKLGPSFVSFPIESPVKLKCPSSEKRGVFQIAGDPPFRTFAREMKLPPRARIFDASQITSIKNVRTAAIGFPVGEGHVVALADPNLLRNDYIRVCRWGLGVSAMRMVEYLASGRHPTDTRIVFDEYHQGFGRQPSVNRAALSFLFYTAPGAVLVQIIVASLILLLAVGPRPIPPAAVTRAQRRSQFEHVEALSSAYQQISATRLVARTLVNGMKRRLLGRSSSAGVAPLTEESFLSQIAVSHPELTAEVATVSSALATKQSPAKLTEAVAAIEKIERTIKS